MTQHSFILNQDQEKKLARGLYSCREQYSGNITGQSVEVQ
jgi:hypothetical protein